MHADFERRRQLRLMKTRATGLLIVVAAVFVVARLNESGRGWVGYVRAAAEAAMVGGLADWFAVTALFRHPLGLPIPHTAIVVNRKDQIGESLGEFVQENFLSADVLADKLRDVGVAARAATWLSNVENARTVAAQAGTAVSGVVEVLKDDDVREIIDQAVVDRIRAIPMAPLAGRALDVMTESGRHHELFEAALNGLINALDERRESLRTRFAEESPWWVPEPIDDRVFDRIFTGLRGFVGEVSTDPRHDLRRHVDERMRELVISLQQSPEMRDRGEALKEELLNHPAMRRWSAALWDDLKASLLTQANDENSPLRQRLEHSLISIASTVRDDPTLQAKVDKWITSAVAYLAQQYRGEVAELISGTVRKWDPNDTADRIETQIGRDLQFIRINGTIVGGLVGVILHAVSGAIG